MRKFLFLAVPVCHLAGFARRFVVNHCTARAPTGSRRYPRGFNGSPAIGRDARGKQLWSPGIWTLPPVPRSVWEGRTKTA
jgi:hypothetical protein